MNLVFQAADTLQTFLREQQWRFCFIGGLAVQHWGEPRVTRDVDVTLLVGFGYEEAEGVEFLGDVSSVVDDADGHRAGVANLVE